ncbi:hypothetical protein FRIGORI9N_60003 [Frigoribacterium sp. 9N]|nr:hypothetical protein FRIGORI9N_60003 [Frigoribacterium sp. 9N]
MSDSCQTSIQACAGERSPIGRPSKMQNI